MARSIPVALGDRSYPVWLTSELPGRALTSVIASLHSSGTRRVLVVTDENVGPLYGADVIAAVVAANCHAELLTIPPGEEHKTLATWEKVVDAAIGAGLRRSDAIVALGGGVVGDIAGFAAASVNRGLRYIQVPTTLLAQVDSSVGGKTGVNHPAGKNLVGAFWQPEAVIASQAVLKTLPQRERRCGLAEAVKHGFIAEPEFVDWTDAHAPELVRLDSDAVSYLVERCVRIKAAVVEADERELGQRAVLNFGHTFGHAFEKETGYGTLSHGEAVGLGMVIAADLSVALGVSSDVALPQRVAEVLSRLGLCNDPYARVWPDLQALIDAARSDKKSVDVDSVNLILLRSLGQPLIQMHTWELIGRAIAPRFASRRN